MAAMKDSMVREAAPAEIEEEILSRRMQEYSTAGSLFGSRGFMSGLRDEMVERILQAELKARRGA